MGGLLTSLMVFVLCAAPGWAAPDDSFDQGVDVRPAVDSIRSAGRLSSAPEAADETLWVSVENGDAAVLTEALGLPMRQPVAMGERVSIYEIRAGQADALAEAMQRERRRSPGFFAYTSLQAAQRDLAPAPAAVFRAQKLDQQAVVTAMLKRVEEPRLVATIEKLASYKNRHAKADTGVASSKWVAQRWQELSAGRSDISVAAFRHSGFPQESVILTVRGSAEPDQVTVLGGHVDSTAGWSGSSAVAPGADDNASGVAVLTEALRVLVESGYRPKSTLKFVAFAAEEIGLRGSGEIADAFKKEGVAVRGMVNFDMANFKGSADDIYMISDNSSQEQNAFLGRLVEAYTDYRWSTTACGYGCSDHASWTKNGFAASFPFESKNGEDNPDIHSAKDTLAAAGGGALHAFKFAQLAVAYLVEMGK